MFMLPLMQIRLIKMRLIQDTFGELVKLTDGHGMPLKTIWRVEEYCTQKRQYLLSDVSEENPDCYVWGHKLCYLAD